MTLTYTQSESVTFTLTHARHIGAKVATDLKRIQRFYGAPSDHWITQFEDEIVQFLKGGYVETVTYGYLKDGQWIEPTLHYTARDFAGPTANDDDPGRIRPNADVAGATFYSYLTYSGDWDALTQSERDSFRKGLPFTRSGAETPSINGYLTADRTYSAGGRALQRESVRSF